MYRPLIRRYKVYGALQMVVPKLLRTASFISDTTLASRTIPDRRACTMIYDALSTVDLLQLRSTKRYEIANHFSGLADP